MEVKLVKNCLILLKRAVGMSQDRYHGKYPDIQYEVNTCVPTP